MRALRSFQTYVVDHWQGRQSLAWSFWVNLVALRIILFSLQTRLAPVEGEDYSHWRVTVLVMVFASHIVLLCWQIVGVIRSADRHFSIHGNMALVWGAQLGATLLFILSTVYALGAVQMTYRLPPEKRATTSPPALAETYAISISRSGSELSIEGYIGTGITRAVRKQLLARPSIVQVRLSSSGGNIFEARGLYKLFSVNGLATHVTARCSSACTTAYAGGALRSASPEAEFGFHQYRMDSPYFTIATNAAAEQRIDEELFLEAGVSKEFVGMMFHRQADDMWWPSLKALQESGVVHELRRQ